MDILDLYLLRAYLLRWRVEDLLAGHDTNGSERAEGVISAAIAVLIMAFLGVAAWFAFKAILGQATHCVSAQVGQIGGSGTGGSCSGGASVGG
jgi:hypothetical protein